MHKQRITYLVKKYSDKTATESERDELIEFVATASNEVISLYLEEIYDSLSKEDKQYFLSTNKRARILEKVFENKPGSAPTVNPENTTSSLYSNQLWVRYASIAALIFIVLSIGFIFYNNNNQPLSHNVAQSAPSIDIQPGGNKATLTLEDGSTITLDELQNGQIAEQSGIVVSKMNGGQLLYTRNGTTNSSASKVGFNTISTPRAGEFQIILPDGTKVWLNAASSLTFPTQFSKTERKVELQGEGYFEVAKNEASPFIVSTAKQVVTVLGTHFNVNSYEDEENVKTTLIEGSVQVSLSNEKNDDAKFRKVRLKPNQQSVLAGAGLNVINVNSEESIAWKNGYFNFQQTALETVMRQLSRWYDIDIEYRGEMPSETFTGKVYRNMNISEVFEVLEFAQVNFKIEGKKMIIFY